MMLLASWTVTVPVTSHDAPSRRAAEHVDLIESVNLAGSVTMSPPTESPSSPPISTLIQPDSPIAVASARRERYVAVFACESLR